MNPLYNLLKTRPIQTGREMSMEPYPNGQFGFIDDPDRQSGSGSVLTRTRTRSDGPDPLLTLIMTWQFISKLTLIQLPWMSPNSLSYCLQVSKVLASHCESPNSLNYGIGVQIWVHTLIIFRCTKNSFLVPPAPSPDIPCVDVELWRYINESTIWIQEF
jgi:hypothetical protein